MWDQTCLRPSGPKGHEDPSHNKVTNPKLEIQPKACIFFYWEREITNACTVYLRSGRDVEEYLRIELERINLCPARDDL